MIYIFVTILAVNLSYWLFIFSKLSSYNSQSKADDVLVDSNQVLLIVVVKNEAKNLEMHLESILRQSGNNFKVLLVDDHSTDGSIDIIEAFKKQYPNLELRKYDKSQGKKKALHDTLLSVEAEYLVFTDGDCRSVSNTWLRLMTECFSESKQIVLGYGPFFKRKGLVNKFARFEAFMTALQYFSYALSGMTYMGVGRNLAYKHLLFKNAGGFSTHLKLLSGDDDLFINQVANTNNTAIQIHPDSFMYSESIRSWKAFFRQKRRHLASSSSYKLLHKLLLSLYAASHILLYFGLFFLNWKLSVAIWSFRIILILLVNFSAFYKLKEQDLLIYFPLLDILMFVYYTFMSVSMLFPKRKQW